MVITISTHNGHAVSREHNIRNEKIVSKENHINPNGVHEIWHDEKHTEAYERIFGASVRAYNEKQQRNDRKIDNYYKNVCNDDKKHPVYEMIIGVYGKDANGQSIVPEAQGKEILHEFVDTWQERNPNLELIGAYYHADEEGEPHVHIDYVPVAHGYKRGMETQNGLDRALREMGYSFSNTHATPQIQWEKAQNDYLDQLCFSKGYVVNHPMVQEAKHIDTKLYKTQQEHEKLERDNKYLQNSVKELHEDIDKLIEKYDTASERLNLVQDELKTVQGSVDTLERKKAVLDRSVASQQQMLDYLTPKIVKAKEIKEQKADKGLFGKSKDTVTLDYQDYSNLFQTATAVEDVQKLAKKLQKREYELNLKRDVISDDNKKAQSELKKAQDLKNNAQAYINQEVQKQLQQRVAMIMQQLKKEQEAKEQEKERYLRALEVMEKFPAGNGKTVKDVFWDMECSRMGIRTSIHDKLAYYQNQVNSSSENRQQKDWELEL